LEPVNVDNSFQYTKDQKVNLYIYQFQDHMKGSTYDNIMEATAQDTLYHYTVSETYHSENKIHWQIHIGILYCQGEGDANCIYILPTTHSNGLKVRDEIMNVTYQELAHF
jgi:hypothetical protein